MIIAELDQLYQENERFRVYVEKYSIKHGLIRDDAIKCAMAREYADYITSKHDEIVLFFK